MVDIKRFSSLLGAVKQLGVKLIVVGDGAQLQPVEAGPAFRLITERIGKSELNTVLRQNEAWQREATLLFGRQQTSEAIQVYQGKGHIHIVKEPLPSLTEALSAKDINKLRQLYEVSTYIAPRLYREIARDLEKDSFNKGTVSIHHHQDHLLYLKWKSIERAAAEYVKTEGERYQLQGIDIRKHAKEELLKQWHADFQSNPKKSSLILTFMNKDVADLNAGARFLLKQS